MCFKCYRYSYNRESLTQYHSIYKSIPFSSLIMHCIILLILLYMIVHPLNTILLKEVYQDDRDQGAGQEDKVEGGEVLDDLDLPRHLLHV